MAQSLLLGSHFADEKITLPFPSLFEANRKTLVVEVVPVQLDNSLVHVVRF